MGPHTHDHRTGSGVPLRTFTKRIPADALNPPSSPAAVSDSDMEMGHVTKSDATVLQVISPSSGSAEMA